MTDSEKKHITLRTDAESCKLHHEAALREGLSVSEWRRQALEKQANLCLGIGGSMNSGFPSNQAERMMLKVVMMLGAHFLYNLSEEEQAKVQAKAKELLAKAMKSDAS